MLSKATEKTCSVSVMMTKSDTAKIKATLKKWKQQVSMTMQRKRDQKDADQIRKEIVRQKESHKKKRHGLRQIKHL